MSSSTNIAPTVRNLDLDWVRQQFPALRQTVNGQPAVSSTRPAVPRCRNR